jgi:hypothetical protein
MPNVNIDVYANTHGAPKDLKEVSGGLEELDKKGGGAGIGLSGLWKQFAVGQIAADALKKAVGAVTDFMKDAIAASAQQELAERNLADAFFTTGRNVEDLLPKFKEFANRIQEETIYTDDAVLSASALIAQLSDLDENGLKRATESAIGMASVFKIDLQSAATSVAKAMAGNYELLGRYLPQLKDLKTEEEKHAFVMQEMAKWYQRAKGETDTFSGSLSQLKNMWDEVKEAVGRAITENKSVRELIDKIKGSIVDLIESGKLEEWVESLSISVSNLIKIFEGFYTAIKTVVDLADKLPSIGKVTRQFYKEQMDYVEKLAAEGKARAEEFKDSLKILDIPLEHLREQMEKGEANWKRYTDEMKALDDALVANKSTIESWVNKIAEFLKIGETAPPKILDIKEAVRRFKEETGLTVTTQDELKDRLDKLTTFWETYGKSLPIDSQNKIKKAIEETKAQLYGLPTKIEIIDEFKKAAPITEELKKKIDDLCRSYEFTLPPARNLMDIIRKAPSEFHDTAVGAWDFNNALKDIADQAMVSENTILQFLWNIRAEFLATMGIMIPKWPEFSTAAQTATADTKNYFDGLYNDIATGWGNTIQKYLEGGLTLKDFFNSLFEDIKASFFRMIGEMVAGEILKKFKDLFSSIFKSATDTMESAAKSAVGAVTDITKGASGAISGLWTGLGAAVGSFLGTLLGNILGGGKGYGEITYWLKPIWENTQVISNRLANEYTDWMTELCVGKNRLIEQQDYHSSLMERMVEHLDAIRSSLSSVTSAQTGFEGQVARQTLFLTHPGEYVRITPPNTPSVQAARGETSIVSNIEAQVYIKPVVIKHDDGYLIDFIQEKIEYVKKQYDRGNWKIPITSVGGA